MASSAASPPATHATRRVPERAVRAKDGAAEAESGTATLDPRLPILSLSSLRDLALLCGRNSSGTRAVLRADLEAALDEAPVLAAPRAATSQRILSIDMGVRNLAYCLLQVEGKAARSDSHRHVPQLLAWERLSLIGSGKGATREDTASAKPPASAFSPPAMAAVAARLIRDRLLPLAPTHVLIERQRFRSGGGAAVLEWTVRVNSLEAMLHGILAYRQLDANKNSKNSNSTFQTIQAVSPRRVSQFLLRGGLSGSKEEQPVSLPAKVTKEKDIKDVKEAFVAGILRASGPRQLLTYNENINDIVDAYLLRWDAKQSKSRRKTKTKETEEDGADGTDRPPLAKPVFTKIDDMADCVAQGLAWLEWEDNKKLLRARGAEHLLETKHIAG
ncbi:hypothetical protein SCUCBS95973_003761 [Sporothrix curviconia]|uniref:Mitochondrial resolvase Ydc2 catalytic domain-containing protein n=1 Tax=Sporothrix curviconia TaxID=1260050 RepID=A0ABP0BI17_9PEZI